jgi:hypothetical protein
MKPDEAEEYTQALGQIVSGGYRQVLLGDQLGVPQALGLTLRGWTEQRLGGYVRMSIQARREAAVELAEEGLSNVKIADALGYDESTIRADLASGNPEPEDQAPDQDEAEHSGNPEPEPSVPLRLDAPEEIETKRPTTRELLEQSENEEWYTPAVYLESARKVMGGIALDPASSQEGNALVQAGEFYTKDKDGLKLPWQGTVWLNPPYGGLVAKFAVRINEQYEKGTISAGILLVNSHPTETKWFQALLRRHPVCFTDHRINFVNGGEGDPEAGGSTHGSAFIYLGPDEAAFAREFARYGTVVQRASAA